ncbi:MAG: tetratricopeptide repeat protein [Thermodesulfobacteriota bacterium]
MGERTNPYRITIDLNEFKLHIELKKKIELTLHFNSPSRRFYLSVIALVVNEMKRQGKITSIPLEKHHDLLALLNDTVGGSAGSSDKVNLLHRIYTKWKDALPNLEEAPLFTVLGRKRGYEEGVGKTYLFTEAEKDCWANLFEYKGSHGKVRLKFAIDKIGATLDDVLIVFEDSQNADAWDQFISSLKDGRRKETKPVEKPAEPAVPEPPVNQIPPPPERKISRVSRYRWVAVAVIVVALGAITLAIWKIYSRPDPGDGASIKKMAFPLPDEPSIAVLPFVNMSGDPKQEFLCDGMTDEIIAALSKVSKLVVIARNSSFVYKGKPVKVKQVSEELGVRYVLEGSLQRPGDRIRITTQLIDALTGNHLWAERYDRDLKDIFALQDEIVLKILTAVQVKLALGTEAFRVEKYSEKYYKGKQGLDCYLKLMAAVPQFARGNIESNNQARRMIEEEIAMCPENPLGYMYLGWVNLFDYILANTKSPRETIEKGVELAQKALAMDDSIAVAHALLGELYAYTREYDKAIAEAERGVALNPGGMTCVRAYGLCLCYAGRPEEAIPVLEKAIRISPSFHWSYLHLGLALGMMGRFEEAVSAFKKAIQLEPNNIDSHIQLAATYSLMGREKEARAEAAEVLRINPKFSVESWKKRSPYKDQSETDRIIAALRKAGLK